MSGRRVPAVSAVAAAIALAAAACATGDRADETVGGHETAAVLTLPELERRLGACVSDSCPHLVYVWSSSMPLSVTAKDEITAAARALRVPVSLLPAEALPDGPPPLRDALVAAGATVHFPTVVLFDGTEPRPNAIAGYKQARAYEALLRPRLADLAAGTPVRAAPIGAVTSLVQQTAAAIGSQSGDIRILWRHALPQAPGAFFRRVPSTRYITYDLRRTVYIRHLETDAQFVAPGFIDFVPTPDGDLFVTPGPANSGLEFYAASEVLDRGRRGQGRRVEPVFVDRQMADQYPSVGILSTGPGRRTTYRVLVSWFEGLAVREYDVIWDHASTVRVVPRTPKTQACPGLALSTPMLSKDGEEIAARDERTGTTKIFRLASGGGQCREVLDIGRQTSKVAFSDDGALIAYSSPNRGDARSTTYVLNRRTQQTVRVPESESFGLVIPEMVGRDSLLLLTRMGRRRGDVEFRLHCCVR